MNNAIRFLKIHIAAGYIDLRTGLTAWHGEQRSINRNHYYIACTQFYFIFYFAGFCFGYFIFCNQYWTYRIIPATVSGDNSEWTCFSYCNLYYFANNIRDTWNDRDLGKNRCFLCEMVLYIEIYCETCIFIVF